MDFKLITPDDNKDIDTPDDLSVGQIANRVAAEHIFQRYQETKAHNTNRRHRADLAAFADCLTRVGHIVAGSLYDDPQAWAGITWGLAESFVRTQLEDGFSMRTVNLRLGTVKLYASMAARAGAINDAEAAMMRTLRGYSGSEARNVDKLRTQTRKGRKKENWTSLDRDQVNRLLVALPKTPQGRRDKLALCLLAFHGLRVSELLSLTAGSYDRSEHTLTWQRQKTGITSNHILRNETRAAMLAYLERDAFTDDLAAPLFRGSLKNGELTTVGWSTQKINARLKLFGKALGIKALSPHDLRHFGATQIARSGATLHELMSWGGWKTADVAMGYIEAAKVDNETVNIDR